MPSAPLFLSVSAFSSVPSEPGLRRGLLALSFSAVALVLVGCNTKDAPKSPDQPTAQAAPTEKSPAPSAEAAPAEDDLEIISTDKKKKTITFRNKKTGKTETLPMDEFYKRASEREKARAKGPAAGSARHQGGQAGRPAAVGGDLPQRGNQEQPSG